jgi:hypothetical protein
MIVNATHPERAAGVRIEGIRVRRRIGEIHDQSRGARGRDGERGANTA